MVIASSTAPRPRPQSPKAHGHPYRADVSVALPPESDGRSGYFSGSLARVKSDSASARAGLALTRGSEPTLTYAFGVRPQPDRRETLNLSRLPCSSSAVSPRNIETCPDIGAGRLAVWVSYGNKNGFLATLIDVDFAGFVWAIATEQPLRSRPGGELRVRGSKEASFFALASSAARQRRPHGGQTPLCRGELHLAEPFC